jgi:hypothetical protein
MLIGDVGQVIAFIVVGLLFLSGLIWTFRSRRHCAFCRSKIKTGASACGQVRQDAALGEGCLTNEWHVPPLLWAADPSMPVSPRNPRGLPSSGDTR